MTSLGVDVKSTIVSNNFQPHYIVILL